MTKQFLFNSWKPYYDSFGIGKNKNSWRCTAQTEQFEELQIWKAFIKFFFSDSCNDCYFMHLKHCYTNGTLRELVFSCKAEKLDAMLTGKSNLSTVLRFALPS